MTGFGAEIVAIEYALPERVETNDDLLRVHPDWDMDAVFRKTGVRARHIAAEDECASDFAFTACSRLFDVTGLARSDVDGLIVCTQSADYVLPPTSALLQERLGLDKGVAAFDFTLACSGFVYGLWMCKAFIESGLLDKIVLVTCDTYSKYIRPDDRATRTLFGDGASASLIQRGARGIGEVAMATDGAGAEKFIVRGGGCRAPARRRAHSMPADRFIEMDGLAVLSFVRKEVPPFVETLLAKASVKYDDIDLFIFHQASQISLDTLSRILKVPAAKMFNNLEYVGNTVSSSIPIALRDAWQAGRLKTGMTVALIGFGVGFSWGGAVIRWTGGSPRGAR